MHKKDYPDHHDAELVMKLYELRREPVMRESRGAVIRGFLPASFEDITAVTANPEHPLNAPYRQVASYWEMVYGMVKHGVLHSEFMLESNGEGLLLFARVAPYLEQIRTTSPRAFVNAEWITKNSETGRAMHAMFTDRAQKQLAARAAKNG